MLPLLCLALEALNVGCSAIEEQCTQVDELRVGKGLGEDVSDVHLPRREHKHDVLVLDCLADEGVAPAEVLGVLLHARVLRRLDRCLVVDVDGCAVLREAKPMQDVLHVLHLLRRCTHFDGLAVHR